MFGVPQDEVTPLMRSNAKAVNFGVIYGMSGFGLSEELSITRKQAEQYIKDYFHRFPGVKQFMDGCIADCKATGEIRTLYGRRRSVPEIHASQYMVRQLGERLAMNTPIQGTAADIIKLAMIRTEKALREQCPEAQLILQIHDELILRVPKAKEEEAKLEEKMVPKTSHYTRDQLQRLGKLSKREGVGEAILLREALDMLLKKYDI